MESVGENVYSGKSPSLEGIGTDRENFNLSGDRTGIKYVNSSKKSSFH
jgi:hypothetical protein